MNTWQVAFFKGYNKIPTVVGTELQKTARDLGAKALVDQKPDWYKDTEYAALPTLPQTADAMPAVRPDWIDQPQQSLSDHVGSLPQVTFRQGG